LTIHQSGITALDFSVYEILLCWSDEDDAFIAEVPELPGRRAQGDARERALQNANEAIQL
jgi:predicted RNase H-like HicB family nuclease